METDEKTKRKNDNKAKGRPLQGLSDRAVLILILFAALVMGIAIVFVIETHSPRPPYPADRVVYNWGTTRYAQDVRTGETTELGQLDEGRKALSPDGEWWAQWVIDGDLGDSSLVLTHARTGEIHTPLETPVYGTGVRVSWSPDSQWIAFHAVPALSSPDEAYELWRVNIQTGALEQLTNNQVMDIDPDFSPDGTKLVYTEERSRIPILQTLTIATGSIKRQPGISAYGGRWSPDGLWILFASHRNEAGPLWIVRSDGTGNHRITRWGEWLNYGWER